MLVQFCLPIYNEEKILAKNVLKLFDYLKNSKDSNFSWQIVLIINGSRDKSLAIAKGLEAKHQKEIKAINILEPGKGNALKIYSKKSQADILVYMDIDLAVTLKNIPNLINPIIENKYDLVIGSRLLKESKIERSFLRELSSQIYSFLARRILGLEIKDFQCGFKAIKQGVFSEIAPYIESKKWFFDTELIAYADKLKFRIKEIPVDWEENRYDERESKVRVIRDSISFLINLIKLKKRLDEKTK